MFKSLQQQKGDTIVEVLIAVAVVTSVLAIAYATMNQNLRTMRDNQERTEAAKLAQGQVEALKAAWATSTGRTAITTARSGPFCMNGSTAPSTGAGTVTTDFMTDNLNGYNVLCTSSFYRLGIRYSAGTYTVTTRWHQLGGERGEVVLAYRLE